MKKLLLIFFSILLAFTFAIAQDGINYQGAATDANGDELTTQNISIRASILSGSASGNLEWEETHSTTTDQFGLFNIVIGQGTNTTNGATATFDDMDWGSGNHYLKIEMDATGGTNYAMIGTTQMMSVPYALYAKSAGIDSAMLSNMIGSSVGGMGGGCDFNFPEGLHGDYVIVDIVSGYTVPSGKNFYITNLFSDQGPTKLTIGGVPTIDIGDLESPMIAISGDVVDWMQISIAYTPPSTVLCMGILVDQDPQVQIMSIDLMAGNYTVPSSKIMVIYHAHHQGATGFINVNGQVVFQAWNRKLPLFLNAGDIVSVSGNPTSTSAFGYLVDENYFAGCGGGGSSSSASAVDSAMVAGMIANAGGGGGCNFVYPDIINNLTTVEISQHSPYTVPNGKNLYLSYWGNFFVNNYSNALENSNSHPLGPIFGSGDVLTSAGGAANIAFGFLVDAHVDPVWIEGNNYPNVEFTVPQNKLLVILGNYGGLEVNGTIVAHGGSHSQYITRPILCSAGDQLVPHNSSRTYGYLVDENYFANCGGGGSSSSPSAVDSAMVAGMINANSFPKFGSSFSEINGYASYSAPQNYGSGNYSSNSYISDTLSLSNNELLIIGMSSSPSCYNNIASSTKMIPGVSVSIEDISGNSLSWDFNTYHSACEYRSHTYYYKNTSAKQVVIRATPNFSWSASNAWTSGSIQFTLKRIN